ncbi:MAG: ankyrin repeat domain-containing protein [Sulfitobacter sp.]
MPILPTRPSLEHLKKQAKRLHHAAGAKDPNALAQVGPYFGDPAEISLQQAQLVIARDYGFSSWAKLKQHLENPPQHLQTTEQSANRFLDLVCLHYGQDLNRGASAFDQAATLLKEHPEIVRHSLHSAAAAGATDIVDDFLAKNPQAVDQKGGPFQWTPLMYAAYARLPGVSTFAAGQSLLAAGADPNFHYMSEGIYRFTVLTGIFGDGEGGKKRLPEHPEMEAFARAVLDAGGYANESQGAYNRCFSPDNRHLELMLEYGLKDSDQSNWWLEEDADRNPDDHRTMHFQLIIALRWGFSERARLLIEHGVDIDCPDNNYYQTFTVNYTPYQVALLRGMPDIAALIKARGGNSSPLRGAERFQAACMVGDLKAARTLAKAHQGKEPEKEAELLIEAAGNGALAAVETMISLGFDLNPKDTRTALHAAAWRGHTEVIKALLVAGADPKLRDPDHFSQPLAHALFAQNGPAIDVLSKADMDIFCAAAMNNIPQIDARLAEDPSWLNAPFSRVRPRPEKEWANDWAPPLWFAAMNGHINCVRHFIELGVDCEMMDSAGRTVADHARQAGHSEIADLTEPQ